MAAVAVRPLTNADLDVLLDVQCEGGDVGLGHIFPQDRYPFPAAREHLGPGG